ncbi:hypothetical protein GCM10022199_17520 [Marihabitans asiaticum]|uniref:SAV-6107-like HEPN domain-containing protein n=1 Tax=Marihabitans asiaticum TaxID=415218 RepID=A0A560W778_9MICO|nr:SAV_6107 family HEPN domain-containing protein [Marihabitans asiaticum]TWD13365.1 hypothetical protein FB557_2766 [Marihabitans asiaticum]
MTEPGAAGARTAPDEHGAPEGAARQVPRAPGACRIEQTTRLLCVAADALTEAHWVQSAAERLAATRLATLRTAAAVLAARGRPGSTGAGARPTDAWRVLVTVAPELGEWASYFEHADRHPPRDVRGVDDLLRAGEDFLITAATTVGLPAPSLPALLVPVEMSSMPVVPGELRADPGEDEITGQAS